MADLNDVVEVLSEILSEIRTTNERMAIIENYIFDIKMDVSTIDSTVSSIESDVSGIQSDVSSIQSDVSTIDSNISNIDLTLSLR